MINLIHLNGVDYVHYNELWWAVDLSTGEFISEKGQELVDLTTLH